MWLILVQFKGHTSTAAKDEGSRDAETVTGALDFLDDKQREIDMHRGIERANHLIWRVLRWY